MPNSNSENISSNKRIAKNTFLLYFRMLLLLCVNLYTSRVVLNQLGVDDYGIYNVVGGIVAILSFLNSAMASGAQRFLNIEMGRNDKTALKKVFSTSLQIHLFIAIIILLIAETVGLWFLHTQMNIPSERVIAAGWVYQFSILSALFGMFAVPFNAVIISHEKMSAFAYISIIEAILKLLVAFLIVWSTFDKLIFYASLVSLVGLINCFIYALYCARHFDECKQFTLHVDLTTLKQMLSFSVWTVFGSLGYILHTQGIAIVINIFFTVAVNAAQGIANQVNGVVSMFTTNFLMALNPQIVKLYAVGDFENMYLLIFRGCKIAFCLMSFFVIPLILEAPVILQIWLGMVPEYAVQFLRLVLIISLVNSFSGILSTAKGATGDIKTYQITLTIIGAFHVPLAWLAFKLGAGPEYAMYIYLIIVIILQIFRIFFVCKDVGLPLGRFSKEVLLVCVCVFVLSTIIPSIFHFLLPTSYVSSMVIVLVSTISTACIAFFVALNKAERGVLINTIKNRINVG